MKKLLLTTAMLTGVAIPAVAETPVYLSLGAGVTSPRDSDFNEAGITGDFEFDNAANFSAAVGTTPMKNVRTEIELSYRKADIDTVSVDGVGPVVATGEVKTFGAMLNGYYDFMEGQKFRPYVSGGIGVARHTGELTAGGITADASDTVFAYQVGVGASYDVAPATALWGGYRYLGTSDPDFDGLDSEYHANEFRGGVRFNF